VWRELIHEMLAEWRFLGERIAVLTGRIEQRQTPTARPSVR